MSGTAPAGTAEERVLVWEWPLRVWHWLLVLCVAGGLITGLAGQIAWMEWHMRFGYATCTLLVFRLIWGFAGGAHSRWRRYRTTPAAVVGYFTNRAAPDSGAPVGAAHTPPGIALSLALISALALQALTGLGATDDIFIEGPLVRYLPGEWVEAANFVHHRAFWIVLAAISVHLCAHLVYGLRGSDVPFAMFSGRKRLVGVTPTPQRGLRGLSIGLLCAALSWAALELAA